MRSSRKAPREIANRASELRRACRAPWESPGAPDPDPGPHHQAQVEAGRVNQHAFQDVRVTPEMGASHAPGFVQVRETALDQLATHPVQPLASLTSDAPAIGVHRLLSIDGVRCLAPEPVSCGRFRFFPMAMPPNYTTYHPRRVRFRLTTGC